LVIKTSVYLDTELKDGLDRLSRLTGRPQAELIREGVERVVRGGLSSSPRIVETFHDESLVGRVDELLEDFGK
jgi:hypothetical protein